MLRYSLFILFSVLAIAGSAQARTENSDSTFTIVDAINLADGTIYIYQPSALDRIVTPHKGGANSSGDHQSARGNAGYRIQIFSDNNMRNAKANAEYRKRLIEQQRPEWRTYITFESPYWRVRVGDFRSQTEADAAMRELKSAFPSFADDMKLVRDKINSAQ